MEVVTLLKQLIACRSLTPDSAGSLELIADRLQAAGFDIYYLPAGKVNNLWASMGETTRLLLAGHVDVVVPGDMDQWRSDPFTPTEVAGHLYGRGAADMKSAVAAMTVAAVAAATAGRADGLGLFLTSDEEGQAIDGTRHFVNWWQQQSTGSIIDYAIIGEPTSDVQFGDNIKIGRRGSLTGAVRFQGKQSHAAYAHYDENPAIRLINSLSRMSQIWCNHDVALARRGAITSFQVVELASGVGATNVTPPFADAVFNFRYVSTDTAEQLRHRTEAVFESIAARKWQCDWTHGATPFLMPDNGHLITALRRSIVDHTGVNPVLTTSGGTSDGRFLHLICHELAEFGVLNTTIHAPNECVRIDDVKTLATLYEQLIYDLL